MSRKRDKIWRHLLSLSAYLCSVPFEKPVIYTHCYRFQLASDLRSAAFNLISIWYRKRIRSTNTYKYIYLQSCKRWRKNIEKPNDHINTALSANIQMCVCKTINNRIFLCVCRSLERERGRQNEGGYILRVHLFWWCKLCVCFRVLAVVYFLAWA